MKFNTKILMYNVAYKSIDTSLHHISHENKSKRYLKILKIYGKIKIYEFNSKEERLFF